MIDNTGKWIKIEKDEYLDIWAKSVRFYKVYLQVAHKNNNPNDNSDNNLVALCSKCHLAMDKAWRSVIRKGNKECNSK